MGFANTPQPDDTGDQFNFKCKYKYFLYGKVPVRMLITSFDRPVQTEALNKETKKFEKSEHLVKIQSDPSGDANEISKEHFYKKCDEYLAYWSPERIKQQKADSDQFQKLIDEGFFDDQ